MQVHRLQSHPYNHRRFGDGRVYPAWAQAQVQAHPHAPGAAQRWQFMCCRRCRLWTCYGTARYRCGCCCGLWACRCRPGYADRCPCCCHGHRQWISSLQGQPPSRSLSAPSSGAGLRRHALSSSCPAWGCSPVAAPAMPQFARAEGAPPESPNGGFEDDPITYVDIPSLVRRGPQEHQATANPQRRGRLRWPE